MPPINNIINLSVPIQEENVSTPTSGDYKKQFMDIDRQVEEMKASESGILADQISTHDVHHGSMATTGGNLMHDKRIVRGSTFAAHPQSHVSSHTSVTHSHAPSLTATASRARQRRRRARGGARWPGAPRPRACAPGPPPAPGRRHHPIQTEYYLEELFDKGVEMEVGVQTDLFQDRPATPLYVPAKTGADAATQIYPGDLFDFDLEVSPILEVLVGKTTEQALAEVAQEEELATLREQQRRYAELRDAERAERQRLAAMDQRLYEEKERRVAEARVAQVAAEEARARAAAATLVQGYVAELLPAVLAGLRDQGYLLERVHRGVDEEFMPWLVSAVSEELDSIITSRDVITEIVRDVVEARNELYRAAAEAEAQVVEPEESITPPSTQEEEEEEPEATT
ncbi:radial spoke head protein 3 homolog [Leguminivora glycinivorella]|uniref:radial spoke head protein 3 homolog n=1 Tax=Leguminivora glycinivorella TaxID=1035111 RepID=UPI00200DC8B4|nr:radial spoke head protein 3 homolog [Leguminivora glycinivorella]